MPYGKAVQDGAVESPRRHEEVHEGHEAGVVSGFQKVGQFMHDDGGAIPRASSDHYEFLPGIGRQSTQGFISSVLATGLGPVNGPAISGQAPGNPPPRLSAPVSVGGSRTDLGRPAKESARAPQRSECRAPPQRKRPNM